MIGFWSKKMAVMFAAALFIFLPAAALSETGIVGSWGGSISAGEYSFGASVTFSQGGSYSIRAGLLTSSGSYSASGSSITLSPSSPPGFSTTTMSLSLSEDGNRAIISGKINGLNGTLSLQRRVVTPKKDPVFAQWQHESDENVFTMELYEGGWAYWHESYEKGRNTRLLQSIREGILDGSLADTAQILALIDGSPLFLEFAGRLNVDGETLTLTPPEEKITVAPSLWLSALEATAEVWHFRASVEDDLLTLRIGEQSLVFKRVGDTGKLPERPVFRVLVPLKPGDKGGLVLLLQQRFAELGLLSAEADGTYGEDTEAAVLAFEKRNSLPEDGIADTALLRLLHGMDTP
jgi:hypothetical protein